MSIHSIQEKQRKQAIYITYKLENVDCLVQLELMSKKVNFLNFSQSYLRLETPFKYFGIEYQESGFITIPIFVQILNQAQKNPIKGASNDVINQLIDDFESIEEDLNQRLVHLFKLSNNPEFSDDKSIKENDRLLMSKIREIDQSISDNYKYRNQNWQLLYVVETTAKIIWNGEEKKIIKLGKTNKSIQDYVLKLRKQYQGKIEFRPLFAQRLYTPQNNLVDKIFFHNELLKSIPDSKVYLKAEENQSSQIHYEFYFLTNEFVNNFEKCLKKFIEKNKQEYDQVLDQSNDKDDNQGEQTLDLLQDIQISSKETFEQKQQEQETLKNNLQEISSIQSKEQESINLILQSDNQNEEQTINEPSEISKSLDETSFEFFDKDPILNQNLLGIPVNYQISEESQEILYEASKMINIENNYLKALLYIAAAKREMKNEK
ncbi:unnamed protein product [Paramecium pentaurelia]|uniref:Uncharacterized protein n=1 Tax=Paramecium pentaurelia TaxID=43138 RepID=A0A8S1XJ65_9CILI|nr:unnamed protein product [Paramecium pentaurelia]